jgi:hypothetical protein
MIPFRLDWWIRPLRHNGQPIIAILPMPQTAPQYSYAIFVRNTFSVSFPSEHATSEFSKLADQKQMNGG